MANAQGYTIKLALMTFSNTGVNTETTLFLYNSMKDGDAYLAKCRI